LEAAVDVVDIDTLNVDMMCLAVIFSHDANPAPDSWRYSRVGHFEIADLPILLILQQDGILRLAAAVDDRLRRAAILVDHDRLALGPGTLRPELSGPHRTGLE